MMLEGTDYKIIDEPNRFGIQFRDGQFHSLSGQWYSIPLMIRVINGEIFLDNDERFQLDVGELYVYFTEGFLTPGMFKLEKV